MKYFTINKIYMRSNATLSDSRFRISVTKLHPRVTIQFPPGAGILLSQALSTRNVRKTSEATEKHELARAPKKAKATKINLTWQLEKVGRPTLAVPIEGKRA